MKIHVQAGHPAVSANGCCVVHLVAVRRPHIRNTTLVLVAELDGGFEGYASVSSSQTRSQRLTDLFRDLNAAYPELRCVQIRTPKDRHFEATLHKALGGIGLEASVQQVDFPTVLPPSLCDDPKAYRLKRILRKIMALMPPPSLSPALPKLVLSKDCFVKILPSPQEYLFEALPDTQMERVPIEVLPVKKKLRLEDIPEWFLIVSVLASLAIGAYAISL